MIREVRVVMGVAGNFVRSAGRSARKSQPGGHRSECQKGDLTIAN